MGYALYQAQIGLKHGSAKPLKAAEADYKAQLEKGKAS